MRSIISAFKFNEDDLKCFPYPKKRIVDLISRLSLPADSFFFLVFTMCNDLCIFMEGVAIVTLSYRSGVLGLGLYGGVVSHTQNDDREV